MEPDLSKFTSVHLKAAGNILLYWNISKPQTHFLTEAKLFLYAFLLVTIAICEWLEYSVQFEQQKESSLAHG